MSKNGRGKKKKCTRKKRKTQGQRAAERMEARDIMGEDTYTTAKMIEYAMSPDDILQKEMPLDERAKHQVRWDRVSASRRAQVHRLQQQLLDRQEEFSIPIEPSGSCEESAEESQARVARISELALSRKPESHDMRVHSNIQEDPATCCLWWWDRRREAPLFSRAADAVATFTRAVLRLDGLQREIMHKHTTYNKAMGVLSRLFDARSNAIRSTWTGKTWDQLSAFIGKNYSYPVRTYRLDPRAGILCVCYPVDRGGRFHVAMLIDVEAPSGKSLKEIAESLDGAKSLIVNLSMATFPVRCPCDHPRSE